VKRKYRLLSGTHHEVHYPTLANGQPSSDPTVMTFRATATEQPVFESDSDLLKMNGGTADTMKYELVGEPVPQTIEEMEAARAELDDRIAAIKAQPASSGVADAAKQGFAAVTDLLDSQTIAELKAIAEEEEINLGNASTKAAIIDVIRKARLG
jgi:hypothetical protein